MPRLITTLTIDERRERFAFEIAPHVFSEDLRDCCAALRMSSADVRENENAFGLPERMRRGKRLFGKPVEKGASDRLRFNGRYQIVIRDERAAAEVEEPRRRLHRAQPFCVDEA